MARFVLLLALSACRADPQPDTKDRAEPEDSDPAPDTDEPDDSAPPVDTAPPPPWGLDERPANPSCRAPDRPLVVGAISARLEPAFPNLQFYRPTSVTHEPGNDAWYVTESEGLVLGFQNDPAVEEAWTVLDIQDRVTGQLEGGGEMGLLGLAFHPAFASNGQVYLSYTTTLDDGSFESRISLFLSTDGGRTFDPASEQIVLNLAQPNRNHNGGRIHFGPDGMLWIGFGDGGGATHQEDAQDPHWLYGKILRIDVDGAGADGTPYGIPTDNPFADGVSGRPEVWAYGFRNPWGWSIDPVTHELWVTDVGTTAWEEVNLVPKGGNHGWPVYEGPDCRRATELCTIPDKVDPVYAYGREEGQTIIGGPVYRGSAIPELQGRYLFADYMSEWVRMLWRDAETGELHVETLFPPIGERISTFTVDSTGEVYLMTFSGRGRLMKILPAEDADTGTEPVEDPFPRLLSETGCVDPADPGTPEGGLIPYAVRSAFWADGLDKRRWMALPDAETITVEPDGDLSFPIGTVLVKELAEGDRPIETRLLVRHEDGNWAGYAYAWDEAGTDAELLEGAARVDLGSGEHEIPARWACKDCHTDEAGGSLGLELSQLSTELVYPSTGRLSEQLLTLQHIGLLPETLPEVPPLPEPSEGTLEEQARAYLHVNCAGCHRPGVERSGHIDLRFTIPLAETGACDALPEGESLGLADARILAPGDPDRSLLALRMARTDLHRMPPVGVTIVDAAGVELVRGWIASLTGCGDE